MSVRRNGDVITVQDKDGDQVSFVRVRNTTPFLAVIAPAGGGVGLDLDDGLALLSFLADTLGVERYVPNDGVPLGDIADT